MFLRGHSIFCYLVNLLFNKNHYLDANTELKTKLAMQQPATVQTQRLEVEEQVEPKCGIAGSIPSICVL